MDPYVLDILLDDAKITPSKTGPLNLGTTAIRGQVSLCCGGAVLCHHKMGSSTPSTH